MKRILLPLVAFAIRHWLRIGLAAVALVLLSRQQLSVRLQLGGADPSPVSTERSQLAGASGLFSLFNVFGGEELPQPLERVERLAHAPVDAFLTRFAHVARSEQDKFGMPASIVLATSLLASQAGTTAASREINNYFGLTAGDGTAPRSYETAWTSFRDFSLHLDAEPYRALRDLGPRDYRKWAAGLEERGLLGRPGLADELVAVIDRYQLFRYD